MYSFFAQTANGFQCSFWKVESLRIILYLVITSIIVFGNIHNYKLKFSLSIATIVKLVHKTGFMNKTIYLRCY